MATHLLTQYFTHYLFLQLNMNTRKNCRAFRERSVPNVYWDSVQRPVDESDQLFLFAHQDTKIYPFNKNQNDPVSVFHQQLLKTQKKFHRQVTSTERGRDQSEKQQRNSRTNPIEDNKQDKQNRYFWKQSELALTGKLENNYVINEKRSLQRNVAKTKPKTDLADQILKQIEDSTASVRKSGSIMNKSKSKKKKAIQQCKVIKIPWKSSSKTGKFEAELSIIERNASKGPHQSLRQIMQNL